jgi:hypothetical protein
MVYRVDVASFAVAKTAGARNGCPPRRDALSEEMQTHNCPPPPVIETKLQNQVIVSSSITHCSTNHYKNSHWLLKAFSAPRNNFCRKWALCNAADFIKIGKGIKNVVHWY